MGLISFPETLVRNYHYLQRNNPEEQSPYLLRSSSLISRDIYGAVYDCILVNTYILVITLMNTYAPGVSL